MGSSAGTSEELGLSTAGHWFLPENTNHSDNSVAYFLDSTFTVPFPYVHVSFPSAKDPTAEKSTAVIFAAAHYEWFRNMKPEDVKAVADEIVARMTAKLYEAYPNLKDKVKFVELATPLAHEFHLGAARGRHGIGERALARQDAVRTEHVAFAEVDEDLVFGLADLA